MTTPPDTHLALPDPEVVGRTMAAMEARGFAAQYVPTGAAALQALLALIPPGSRVAHGSSTTLQQIGFVAALQAGTSGYHYLNEEWLRENDTVQRFRRRGELSLTADYYLGSVQAIVETGEVVGADGSGSRQAFYTFGPPHVIWVTGINKLVPTLDAAIRRVREVAWPLEDQRVKAGGGAGSAINKLVIYEGDRPGRIQAILIGESLGF